MCIIAELNKHYPCEMQEVARAIIEVSDKKIPYKDFNGLKDLIATLIDTYRRDPDERNNHDDGRRTGKVV